MSELGLYDMNMRYVVEPGDFDFMIGTSSDSICFKKTIHVGEVDAKAERVSSAASKETQTVRTGKKMIVKGVVRDVQAKTLDGVKVSVKGRKGSVITNGKVNIPLKLLLQVYWFSVGRDMICRKWK